MRRQHHDLAVWQEGIGLVKAVYAVTGQFPVDERFGLIAQLRRAAVSIPSNIVEGAARGSDKELARFRLMARASLSELETQFVISRELGYLSDSSELDERIDRLFGKLGNLLKRVQDRL